MISASASLSEFQQLNIRIYLVVNNRNYSIADMVSRFHRHVTQILKAVRKQSYDTIDYHICMAFSWALALFNRFHIELHSEMWNRFPGVCPYCGEAPCACRERRAERHPMETYLARGESTPSSLAEWQEMFARIYPNAIQVSAMHLAEEAGEVSEAVQAYAANHRHEWFDKIVEELVDAVTNIFGVANCLGRSLADIMVHYFANGCPKCRKRLCECGYHPDDPPVPHSV